MKAIKIDVATKSIYQVELTTKNGSHLASIYSHIGCELITSVPLDLPGNDGLLVDDEGLMKKDEQLPGAFLFNGYPQVLAGVTWRGIGDLVPPHIGFIALP